MNTRVVGSLQEDIAISYLKENGFEILERNFKCKIGEIDVIAKKDNIIRFIEIKYRKSNVAGGVFHAISQKKLIKISKIANFYIMINGLTNSMFSIDALLIENTEITYLENIFGGM
ncbi:MAG: YraN family protein [Eubacterium sp.]|nr:YraN family protein [Eubacterium sp.]